MNYLDSSAIIKLIYEEDESTALEQWLRLSQSKSAVTSDLSLVEVLRTCKIKGASSIATARQLLSGIDIIPISKEIIEFASVLDPKELRSLDAIHLASALSIREELEFFVAYDKRLTTAASKAGLAVVAPK